MFHTEVFLGILLNSVDWICFQSILIPRLLLCLFLVLFFAAGGGFILIDGSATQGQR